MSWSGATSGAIIGAQIGSIVPGWGTAIGGAIGGLVGGIATRKSKEEKAVASFYEQLSKGVSAAEAAQEKSIMEGKVEAASAEEDAKLVKRGGVSNASGGVSGTAMAASLQNRALARRARTEAIGKQQTALGDRSMQMKIAGMQGTSAIAQADRLDKEKAMNLLLTSDIGADTLKKSGEGLSEITGIGKTA